MSRKDELMERLDSTTDFEFNFDGTAAFGGAEIEFFGEIDESSELASTSESTDVQLVGTTQRGVRYVAIDGYGWTLGLEPAAA